MSTVVIAPSGELSVQVCKHHDQTTAHNYAHTRMHIQTYTHPTASLGTARETHDHVYMYIITRNVHVYTQYVLTWQSISPTTLILKLSFRNHGTLHNTDIIMLLHSIVCTCLCKYATCTQQVCIVRLHA